MLTAAPALRLAPDHWLDWLRHRSIADNLRGLLLKIRLATPACARHDRKAKRLVAMIAAAENAERDALRVLIAIENQYQRDKKSKRLRRLVQTTCPTPPRRHDLCWLLVLMLFKPTDRSKF